MSITLVNVRLPVFVRGKRVENLLQRRLKDGSLRFDFAAHGKTRVLKARTIEQALAELRQLQALQLTGEIVETDPRLTVSRLVELYLEYAEPRLRPRTLELYEQRLTAYIVPALGRRRAGELDVRSLREFSARLVDGRIRGTNGKPMSGNSARGVLVALSSCLEFGVEFHGLRSNPVRQLGRKHRPSSKRRREPNYMSSTELEKLLERIGPNYRPLLETLAFTGLRISEALSLPWADLELEVGLLRVSVSKTEAGTERPVKLLPRALRVLEAHRKAQAGAGIQFVRPEAFVFVNPKTGTVPHRRNVLRAVSHASAGASTLHDLRHSLIALALQNGATLPEAAELARHASPQVTAVVYAGVIKGAEHRAVEKLAAAGVGA
jgi:integrase